MRRTSRRWLTRGRLGLGLALLAAAGPVACGDEPAGAGAEPVSAGWTAHVDAEDGFRVAFPSGWQRARRSLTPALSDPVEILSVGTGPLARRRGTCAHLPVAALDAMGRTDAFVTLQERRPRTGSARISGYPPRPQRFTLGTANASEVGGCQRGSQRIDTWWMPFTDRGRAFYALVALGRGASPGRRAQVLEVLDSLRFDAAAASPGG